MHTHDTHHHDRDQSPADREQPAQQAEPGQQTEQRQQSDEAAGHHGCGHRHAGQDHGERRGSGPRRGDGHDGHRGFDPDARRAFRPMRGFGPRPFGPHTFPARDGDAPDGGHRRRERRLDRRVLRTARLITVAEHRAGPEAVERTMAASVSHADHRTTMRTLRTIARAIRQEHLHG